METVSQGIECVFPSSSLYRVQRPSFLCEEHGKSLPVHVDFDCFLSTRALALWAAEENLRCHRSSRFEQQYVAVLIVVTSPETFPPAGGVAVFRLDYEYNV